MLPLRKIFAASVMVAVTASAQISFDRTVTQASGAPQPATPPEQRCVLSGIVVDQMTGEPLRKAEVRLLPGSGWMLINPSGTTYLAPHYSTTSQADGSFKIQNIEPGEYLLSGQGSGYLSSSYGAKRYNAPGSVLTLKPAQQRTAIRLALIPQAVISGKVTDEDGDSLSGVQVQARRPQRQGNRRIDIPLANAQTDDRGEFRLAGVAPGKLYISAEKAGNAFSHANERVEGSGTPQTPVRTFYPEAISRDAAVLLTVQAGQELTGINIRMRVASSYHVRGKVVPSGALGRMILLIQSTDEPLGASQHGAVLDDDFNFDAAGITPGSYDVIAQPMEGRNAQGGHQRIQVGEGDVNGVVVSLQTPFVLKGVVRLEANEGSKPAGRDLSQVHVSLRSVDSMMFFGNSASATPGPDGSFVLENVSPNRWFVSLSPLDGLYLKSVRFGGQEILGQELDLSNGVTAPLELTLSGRAAQIQGVVPELQTKEAAGMDGGGRGRVLVALVSEERRNDLDGNFAPVDQTGAFTLRSVAPGRYKVLAVEQGSSIDVNDPDVLAALGTKAVTVEVKENETKAIQVPLISFEELELAAQKLGLEP